MNRIAVLNGGQRDRHALYDDTNFNNVAPDSSASCHSSGEVTGCVVGGEADDNIPTEEYLGTAPVAGGL